MKRELIAMLVVGLFITVASTTAISADPVDEGSNVITIIKGVDDEGLIEEKMTVEASDAEILSGQFESFKSWIQETRPFMDLTLTEDEKNEIETRVNEVITTLNSMLEANDLEPVDINWLCTEMFETEPGRSTIVSVGRGYAFIPFYEYESFLGVMLRPMWLLYPPLFLGGGGYTGNFNINLIPPRIEYGDRLGGHLVRTTIFSGLYINIGDLGYDNIFSGLILLMGRARVVM